MRPITATVSDASGGVKYSPWVYFDPYAFPQVAFQCNVTGTANYTIQQTMDDPNSPTNPVAVASVTWFDNPTAALVGASTSQQGSYAIAPAYVRIKLNSGNGSVSGTFIQYGNVVK